MMNFKKMVESELLALKAFNTKLCITDNSIINETKKAAKPAKAKKAPAPTPTPTVETPFYDLLSVIANNNNMLHDKVMNLIPLIETGASLGRGGQSYSSKSILLRERQNFPLLDLGYSIWTNAIQNGAKPDNIKKILNNPNVKMKDIRSVMGVADLTKMLKLLSWDILSNVKFKDFEEHDFKSPRLRQLFNVVSGGIAINEYHNKTILETLLEITKIKSQTEKFNFKESKVLDVIYYPLEYARGKKSIDDSMARGLLSCVESIISWYIDNLEKNKMIDKDVGEDASVVGSELARKKEFQLQKGYVELLKGESNKLPSMVIPDVTVAGVKPDPAYLERTLNNIKKVKDCKSIAPEIYQAISQYAQSLKVKSKNWTERFRDAAASLEEMF